MNFQRVRRGNRGPDITPMFDVMVCWLGCWMVVFTVRTAPLGLNVELPGQ